MFDQVKVNQNSLVNLLKIPERENADLLSKKTGSDFNAMVMEKAGYDDKKNSTVNKSEQPAVQDRNDEKFKPVNSIQNSGKDENAKATGNKNHEVNSSEEKISSKDAKVTETNDAAKQDLGNKEVKKLVENSPKDAKTKKTANKNSEDEISIINQLNGENNIKTLMAVIKAVFTGDKKAEENNFDKLFSNLKPRQDKGNSNLTTILNKKIKDNIQQILPETFSSITRGLKDSISKEISKIIENRKTGSKVPVLNDKELKELAHSIIDGIKKNKAKEIVKHEAKIASTDEVRIEKKPLVSVDQQLLKKTEISDDSSFDKNGGKDKNSGKENFSYNGGKIDFSARSGLEKMEHSLKMSDFRENLQEIIDKSKITIRDSRNGAFTIKLNPQELGNVNVNLVMENGVITGKFLVDNEDVKSMLLSSLNDLKYQLEEAGIAVGEFSVNVNDQREKYLKQKDDEFLKSLSSMNSGRDVIAAADQYESNTAAHVGHINLVI